MILRRLLSEPYTPVEDMIVLAVTVFLIKVIIAVTIWRMIYA